MSSERNNEPKQELQHMTDAAMPTSGSSTTQSLDRALNLLDLVVAASDTGATLATLCGQSGLSKPTVHRLMTGLRNAGIVDYNPAQRIFLPSFKLYQMGIKIAPRFDLVHQLGPTMDRLCAATGDTVYLSVRSGDHAICVARRVGSYPIQTLTLNVGDSRPLGLGAGSLALLATLPDSECRLTVARNEPLLAGRQNYSTEKLLGYVNQTRLNGYATNEGLMLPEMAAVGVALQGTSDFVSAAISIATIRSRMPASRIADVAAMIKREIALIGKNPELNTSFYTSPSSESL
jgi:DNA-binding IclR family transcriptional regulator